MHFGCKEARKRLILLSILIKHFLLIGLPDGWMPKWRILFVRQERETFSCSCKLPWSGQRCEVNSSEPLLSFRVSCFVINSIFFHKKKSFHVLTSSVLMLILFLIFVTKLPGRPVRDARLIWPPVPDMFLGRV